MSSSAFERCLPKAYCDVMLLLFNACETVYQGSAALRKNEGKILKKISRMIPRISLNGSLSTEALIYNKAKA